MNSSKKIVTICGSCRSLINFRGPLLKRCLDAGYVVSATAPDQDAETVAELMELGIQFVPLPFQRTGMNPFADFVYFCRLYKFLRQQAPSAVFVYGIKPVLYGSLVASLLGIRSQYVLISGAGAAFAEVNSGGRRLLFTGVRSLYRLALKKVSIIFFQNPDDVATFESNKLTPRDARVVQVNGSGVDLEYFSHVPIPTSPIHFLFVGRLIKEKGVYDFLEAARVLKKNYGLMVTFTLLGPCDSHAGAVSPEELEQWAAEGIVEYLGEVRDVRPIIADASVLVLPSYYMEGVPRSILEAMAMGRPIVTTQHRGCKETVDSGLNGFLVPPRDPEALVEAMARFVEAPDLIVRMGLESRRMAEKRFDAEVVADLMMSAISDEA